jgi:hypothetical protein
MTYTNYFSQSSKQRDSSLAATSTVKSSRQFDPMLMLDLEQRTILVTLGVSVARLHKTKERLSH